MNFRFGLQIITNGKDTEAVDNEGCRLPTMVYMAREKRPGYPHNFKAGAMNALVTICIATSSMILQGYYITLVSPINILSNNNLKINERKKILLRKSSVGSDPS